MGKGKKRSRSDDSNHVPFAPILTSNNKKITWNEFQQLICWVVGQGSKFEPPLPIRFTSNKPPKTVAIIIIPYLNYSDLVAYLYVAAFFKGLITKQSLFQMSLPRNVLVSGICRIMQSLVTIEYLIPPSGETQEKYSISDSMLTSEQIEANMFPNAGTEFTQEINYNADKASIADKLNQAFLYDYKTIKRADEIGIDSVCKRKRAEKNIFSSDFIQEYQNTLNLLSEDPDFPNLLGLDCEMCITKNGFELTRISIVDPYLHVVFDSLVSPDDQILDYCTKYSGITRELMEGVDVKLSNVIERLKTLIHPNSILVGHSLENDLVACKIKHNRVIDTSVLYQPINQTFKYSLASLAWKYMKIDMNRELGHDSVNDARVAMALAMNWIVKGNLANELASTHIFNALTDNSIILKSKNKVKAEASVDTLIFDSDLGDTNEMNSCDKVQMISVSNLSDEECAKKFADEMSQSSDSKTRVGICFLRDFQREALNGLTIGNDRILSEIPCSTVSRLIKNASEAVENVANSLAPGSYIFIASCSGDAIRSKLLSTLHYVLVKDGEAQAGNPICENLKSLSKQLGVCDFNMNFDQLQEHAKKFGENQLVRESQLANTNFKAAWGAIAVRI